MEWLNASVERCCLAKRCTSATIESSEGKGISSTLCGNGLPDCPRPSMICLPLTGTAVQPLDSCVSLLAIAKAEVGLGLGRIDVSMFRYGVAKLLGDPRLYVNTSDGKGEWIQKVSQRVVVDESLGFAEMRCQSQPLIKYIPASDSYQRPWRQRMCGTQTLFEPLMCDHDVTTRGFGSYLACLDMVHVGARPCMSSQADSL